MTTSTPDPFPTPWVVQILPFVAGPPDPHGNPAEGWADPITVQVYGWGPSTAGTEPGESGRNAVVTEIEVYAPGSVQVSARDRMRLQGDPSTYEVVGLAEDFTHGPFGWAPGIRINLKRVDG